MSGSAATDLRVELLDALVERDIPLLPQVDVAASYLIPPDLSGGVGADWFDVVPRADGGVVLVVGDVPLRGTRALGLMSRLRPALAERLSAGVPLGDAVSALDAFVRDVPEAAGTTLCVAHVQPGAGLLQYCTAGHPAPLLLPAAGGARLLPASGAGPLGSGLDCTPREQGLGEGDMLVLYTDGLLTAGEPDAQGVLRALECLDKAHGTRLLEASPRTRSTGLCSDLSEVATCLPPVRDDVVLLAAQVVAAPARLELRLEAEPGSQRHWRAAFDEYLTGLDVRPLDRMAAQHATGEVVSNAIEHGSPEGGVVRVAAALDDSGQLVVSVQDQGTWVTSLRRQRGRGRGLALARGFSDRLHIDRSDEGTTVVLRFSLRRDVPIHTTSSGGSEDAGGRPAPVPAVDEMDLQPDDGGLVVRGVVDDESADRLRLGLLKASQGGTSRLTVDLSAVSFLSSAGVSALYDAVGWEGQGGAAVQLRTSSGSAAQAVFDVVGLPWTAPGG